MRRGENFLPTPDDWATSRQSPVRQLLFGGGLLHGQNAQSVKRWTKNKFVSWFLFFCGSRVVSESFFFNLDEHSITGGISCSGGGSQELVTASRDRPFETSPTRPSQPGPKLKAFSKKKFCYFAPEPVTRPVQDPPPGQCGGRLKTPTLTS